MKTPFQLVAAVANVPVGSIPTSFNYKNPYADGRYSWSFPFTCPEGKIAHITDLFFMDKNIETFQAGWRPNYCIFFSLWTLTSRAPRLHLITPIRCGPGFEIGGSFTNHSPEEQNMIAGMTGYLEDIP